MMNLKEKYLELENGQFIVGVIDGYDSVLSLITNDKTISLTHDEIFGHSFERKWRFSLSDGYPKQSILSIPLDEQDFELVREHLFNKYKIEFWENGHFDIKKFNEILKGGK